MQRGRCGRLDAEDVVVWIKNGKLHHKQFRLARRIFYCHQGRGTATGPRHGIYEFDQCLMRDAQLAGLLSTAQHVAGCGALARVSWVAAIDEDIRVNEGSHEANLDRRCRDPYASSLGFRE
jgi:hypothetical protein